MEIATEQARQDHETWSRNLRRKPHWTWAEFAPCDCKGSASNSRERQQSNAVKGGTKACFHSKMQGGTHTHTHKCNHCDDLVKVGQPQRNSCQKMCRDSSTSFQHTLKNAHQNRQVAPFPGGTVSARLHRSLHKFNTNTQHQPSRQGQNWDMKEAKHMHNWN